MPLLLSNQTPGGPVSPEEYAGEGVRFDPSSGLIQDATANADTSKLTISLWMKCHTPPVTTKFGPLFTITAPNVAIGGGFEADYLLGVSSIRPGTVASVDMNAKGFSGTTQVASAGATNYDHDPLPDETEYHHVFQTFDGTVDPPTRTLHVDGTDSSLTLTSATGWPHTVSIAGKNIGFPSSSDVLADPLRFGTWSAGYPADFSDVQIWLGTAIDPAGTQTKYSASSLASRTIRDMVNYMNSRGVSPLEALAVMNIESTYGRDDRNYFQFKIQSSFNSILGYTGVTTNATDLNRAFANEWLGLRPDGSPTPTPNNLDRQVRAITGIDPLGWQKYAQHNLGGSLPGGGRTSINGYDLLQAWEETPTVTLGSLGGLTLMLNQSKIWGSTGPIGTVTTSTTVLAAVNALITVWNAAVADAQRFLDQGTVPNLSYFIDEDGFAVPPAAATDKFGLQTFLFTGEATDFIDNDGSGGAVSLVGGITTVAGPND